MKRHVYVPIHLFNEDGTPPPSAIHLAERLQLSVVAGQEGDLITVVKTPEFRELVYPEEVGCGHTIQIDYTDEFVTFNREISMVIVGPEIRFVIKPNLIEQHFTKFRPRIARSGFYDFFIVNNDFCIDEPVSVLENLSMAKGRFTVS